MEEEFAKEEKIPMELKAKAYRKMLYHSFKYPSVKVYGVLVGQSHPFVLTDCYPLFHTPIVNPILDISLDLIQSNLSEGEKILALYEFIDNSEPAIPKLIRNVAQLKSLVAVWSNGKSVEVGASGYDVMSQVSFQELAQELKAGKHWTLVDMDTHLEEIELDFTNRQVQ